MDGIAFVLVFALVLAVVGAFAALSGEDSRPTVGDDHLAHHSTGNI